jgi:hypothetical protein
VPADYSTVPAYLRISQDLFEKRGVHEMTKKIWLLIAVCFFLLWGCRDQRPVEQSWGKMKGLEYVVGNMNDDSYSTGRTQEPRLNALGESVHMTDFEGEFVWFVHVGYLQGEQIKQVIDYYRTGWEKWSETGETADWMALR